MPKHTPVKSSKKKKVKISEEHMEERQRMTTLAEAGALPPTKDANDGDDEDDNVITCEIMSEPPEIDTSIAIEKPWLVRRLLSSKHGAKLTYCIKMACCVSLLCSFVSFILVGGLLVNKILSRSDTGVCSPDEEDVNKTDDLGDDDAIKGAVSLENSYNTIMKLAVDPIIRVACSL